MNYQRLHDAIIAYHQQNPPTGYTEKHHIVPRCMGGSNEKTNLVRLTARAHFVVHRLLCKIYPSNGKLLYAFQLMFASNNTATRGADAGWFRSSSKLYSAHKLAYSAQRSVDMSGIPKSMEWKTHMSGVMRGRIDPRTVSGKQRQIAAVAKTYKITFPDGNVAAITNLRKFCRELNLNQGAMSRMQNSRGKYTHHKGFQVVLLG